MSKRLGIIGCGQLSQMLGEAANRLGYAVCYMCVDETPVVAGLGPIYYPEQLNDFLEQCDAITVERESLPDDMLLRAAEVGLAPNYEALVVLRERDTQKAMLDQLNIPTLGRWFPQQISWVVRWRSCQASMRAVNVHWVATTAVVNGGLIVIP